MPDQAEELISNIASEVQEMMRDDSTGHDWWHVKRVRDMAIKLAKAEGANLRTVELAALLHDLDDYKITGAESRELTRARALLSEFQVDKETTEKVLRIIPSISFTGIEETTADTLEGKVVQDADRLDALGAIGIARTFAYGGAKNRPIYDPSVPPATYKSFSEYKKNTSPTINHFYEKLLLLKDHMNTESGKKIAAERHAMMEEFLKHFYEEWGVEPKHRTAGTR